MKSVLQFVIYIIAIAITLNTRPRNVKNPKVFNKYLTIRASPEVHLFLCVEQMCYCVMA